MAQKFELKNRVSLPTQSKFAVEINRGMKRLTSIIEHLMAE